MTAIIEDQRGSSRLGAGNFVGRHDLVAEVAETLRPHPFAVMLDGEPGVGKTTIADRVVTEVIDQIPEGGVRFRLAATRAGRRIPLAPFAALLTSKADFNENALAFLPRAISAELHRRSQGAQVIVHVDDVHHFDPASARVLDALIRMEQLRCVLTCRTEPGAGTEATQREALEVIALSEPVRASALQRLVAPADVTTLFDDGFITRHRAVGIDSGETRLRIAHPIYADAVRALVSPSRRLELYRALYHDTERSDAMSPTELVRAGSWAVDCGVTCPMDWLSRAHKLSQVLHDQDLTIMVAGAVVAHPEAGALMKVTALIDRSHAHRILGQAVLAQRDAEDAGRLLEQEVWPRGADVESALPALILRQALAAADVEQYQWDNFESSLAHLDEAGRVLSSMSGGESALRSLKVERALRSGFAGDFSGAMEQASRGLRFQRWHWPQADRPRRRGWCVRSR